MAHLGSFGRAVADYDATEEEPDTFDFYGEVFEIPARLSSLVLMRFADIAKRCQDEQETAKVRLVQAQAEHDRATTGEARAAAVEDISAARYATATAETAGTAAMYRFVQACIGDAQWERFEGLAMERGVSQEELLEVAGAVYSAVAGRPTRRPSVVSGGPSSTGDGSMVGAGSPVPTGGPSPLGTDSGGTVVPLSAAAAQASEMRSLMRPVGELLASGG